MDKFNDKSDIWHFSRPSLFFRILLNLRLLYCSIIGSESLIKNWYFSWSYEKATSELKGSVSGSRKKKIGRRTPKKINCIKSDGSRLDSYNISFKQSSRTWQSKNVDLVIYNVWTMIFENLYHGERSIIGQIFIKKNSLTMEMHDLIKNKAKIK